MITTSRETRHRHADIRKALARFSEKHKLASSWHECDVNCIVTGHTLDNAMPLELDAHGEFRIILSKEGEILELNLADVLAALSEPHRLDVTRESYI